MPLAVLLCCKLPPCPNRLISICRVHAALPDLYCRSPPGLSTLDLGPSTASMLRCRVTHPLGHIEAQDTLYYQAFYNTLILNAGTLGLLSTCYVPVSYHHTTPEAQDTLDYQA